MDDKKLLLKNSLSGVIQLIITAILTFVCVPILIAKLGLNVYGIFAIFSVISNVSTLADLGMDRALIVYLAKQGKCIESNYDIVVALIMKFVLLLAVLGACFYFEHFILMDLLVIPVDYYEDARFFYRMVLYSNFFMVLGMSFASVLDSLQKVYLNSNFRLVYTFLYWGGILFVLLLNAGLREIGIVSFFAAVVWFVLTAVTAKKDWGGMSISDLSHHFGRVFTKQIAYSTKIFSASLLNLFFEPLSKVMISNLIGLDCVALFDIALRIRGQIASLFSKAIYPLGPYIANTPVTEKLKSLLVDITQKIHLVVIPIALSLLFVSKALICIWMGNDSDVEDLALFVAVLCGSFLLLVPPTYPIYQYLYTKLLAGKTVYIQLLNVGVNTIVFLLLYKYCGIYTILIANTCAYFFSYLLSIFYLYKYVGKVNLNGFYYRMMTGATFTLCVGILIYILVPFTLYDILIYPIAILCAYLLAVRYLKLIVRKDISTYFYSYPKMLKLASYIFK